MSIHPLPQFEADLAEYLQEKEDRDAYEKLKAPSSIVVRFGYSMMVGEFPYQGEVKPGCGSKLVVRTQRGTELGEMLTSTCANSGCSKSVSRKDMLAYIENSGGRKYPFYDQGQVLRVAEKADLDESARLEQSKHGLRTIVRSRIKAHGLDMKLVEVEPILGGERIIVYFGSEERVDFRELVKELQIDLKNRVELVQVGARDEARIVADYERCGQYCCCKNFLKVLKPISMKSAKIQKATLDPLKISGRCGRLMCCLRYEDETYEELRKNLPHRKSRVGTPDGDGIVLDSQILTQLSKIMLDDGTIIAVPIEELTAPTHAKAPAPGEAPSGRGMRSERGPRSGADAERPRRKRSSDAGAGSAGVVEHPTRDVESGGDGEGGEERPKRRRRRQGSKRPRRNREGDSTAGGGSESSSGGASAPGGGSSGPSGSSSGPDSSGSSGSSASSSSSDGSGGEGAAKKKRRRKRRRRGGSGEGGAGSSGRSGGDSGGGDGAGGGSE